MKVLGLLAQKGGVGKTTLSVHLSVLAQAKGRRVVLVDCDKQGSAAAWWNTRPAETPELIQIGADKLAAALAAARADGVDLVVVDTAPAISGETATVSALLDFALIPTRPGILDLRAIGSTVEVVRVVGTPAAIVLNSCPAGRGFGGADASVTAEARTGLAGYGLELAPVAITQRVALAHALIDGRSVTELEPGGKASKEIATLWKWLEGKLWQQNAVR